MHKLHSKDQSSSDEESPRAAGGFDLLKRKAPKTEGKDKKKEEKDKRETAVDGVTMAQPVSQTYLAVQKYVEKVLTMGVSALREEYRSLAKHTMEGMTQVAFNENQMMFPNSKSRAPCQDKKRVVLKSPPAACGFIHANYVDTLLSERMFICTQSPLRRTIDDFWWLVWQQKAEYIIMLSQVVENGKCKSAQYWPVEVGEKRQVTNGAMVVEKIDMKPMTGEPTILITDLKMTVGAETRNVRHFQWLDWPDEGVPPCRLTSMELLSSVRGSKESIVVHCQDGMGRTGTIVAIEYLLEVISAGREYIAMGDLMKDLRQQRAFSIQNDLQYLYIHRVMLCYLLEKYKEKYRALLTEENKAKLEKFVEEYNAAVGET